MAGDIYSSRLKSFVVQVAFCDVFCRALINSFRWFCNGHFMEVFVSGCVAIFFSWFCQLLQSFYPPGEAGDVWRPTPVWNIRTVVWFPFLVSTLVFRPSLLGLFVLSCFLFCFANGLFSIFSFFLSFFLLSFLLLLLLLLLLNKGNIAGNNSSKMCGWCLCMYALFYICVGIEFVDLT